ncbi:hypothetical protein OROHE_005949 [Orobanche hederae]
MGRGSLILYLPRNRGFQSSITDRGHRRLRSRVHRQSLPPRQLPAPR